jgi:hypothetical protein
LGTFLYLVATGNEAALQQQFQLSLAQAGQVRHHHVLRSPASATTTK